MHRPAPFPAPTRRLALISAFALLQAACAHRLAPVATPATEAPEDAVRRALAPTGALRLAVYPGSPTSLVQAPGEPEPRGLTVEIGRELARRIGVPATIVVFPRVAEVIAAVRRGEADFTITNATDERRLELDFTAPLLALELGVLVRADAPLSDLQELDRAGLRIGVSQGSSSQRALGARLQQAVLLPQPTLQVAAEELIAARLDAFATNKGILSELERLVPGSRVLPGRWGLEHLAIATAQGRDAAMPYLHRFAASVRDSTLLGSAAKRAGLRGVAAALEP